MIADGVLELAWQAVLARAPIPAERKRAEMRLMFLEGAIAAAQHILGSPGTKLPEMQARGLALVGEIAFATAATAEELRLLQARPRPAPEHPTPVEFEQQTVILREPAGMPECMPLPVLVEEIDGVRSFTSCWKIPASEIAELISTQRIYLKVYGSGQPPVAVFVRW